MEPLSGAPVPVSSCPQRICQVIVIPYFSMYFVGSFAVLKRKKKHFSNRNPCLLCLGGTQLAGAFRLEKDAAFVREEMNEFDRILFLWNNIDD